jgi:hypothetical protein
VASTARHTLLGRRHPGAIRCVIFWGESHGAGNLKEERKGTPGREGRRTPDREALPCPTRIQNKTIKPEVFGRCPPHTPHASREREILSFKRAGSPFAAVGLEIIDHRTFSVRGALPEITNASRRPIQGEKHGENAESTSDVGWGRWADRAPVGVGKIGHFKSRNIEETPSRRQKRRRHSKSAVGPACNIYHGRGCLWFSFSILQLSINSQAYDISIRHSFAARDPRIILTLVVERVSCSRQCQRLRSLSSSNGIRLNHDKILKDWGWSKASIPRRSEELRERKKKNRNFFEARSSIEVLTTAPRSNPCSLSSNGAWEGGN